MATPVPPDDPDGVRVKSCGLRMGPSIELRVTPDANSLMFAFAQDDRAGLAQASAR